MWIYSCHWSHKVPTSLANQGEQPTKRKPCRVWVEQEHGSLKGLSDTQDAAREEESTKIPTAILFDFLFSWAIWDDGENNYWIRQVDVKQKLRVPTKDGKTANNGKNRITPMKRKDKGCGGLPVNSGSQSSTPQVRSVTNSNFEHNLIHIIVKSIL